MKYGAHVFDNRTLLLSYQLRLYKIRLTRCIGRFKAHHNTLKRVKTQAFQHQRSRPTKNARDDYIKSTHSLCRSNCAAISSRETTMSPPVMSKSLKSVPLQFVFDPFVFDIGVVVVGGERFWRRALVASVVVGNVRLRCFYK